MGQATANPMIRWWRQCFVDTVDHREVCERVRTEARPSGHYFFMTMVSAGIAIIGMLLSSPTVVIGAMLLSPLMGPMVRFGFGLAMFDLGEIRAGMFWLLGGAVLAVLFCALIVLISPLQTVTNEIAARTRPNLFDLAVAILSGLAGAYATIRGRFGAIVGVAIAVAVMPPLAVMGFGLATLDGPIFWGAAFLFFTNLMAIGLSAAILARFYGFGHRLSPSQTWLQASLIIGILVALAIPLALALRQIAWEAFATRQSQDVIAAQFEAGARVSDVGIDYDSRPLLVTATVFTPAVQTAAEARAARNLSELLDLPVTVMLEQVQVAGDEAGATQLASARGAADRGGDRVKERLALVAGVERDAVLVDTDSRVARVRASALPGATLRAYQLLEARVAAQERGWTILLVPPPAPLPDLSSADEPTEDANPLALETIAWAQRRREAPIGVSGTRAEAAAAMLQAAGIDARADEASSRGPLRLRWLASGEEARVADPPPPV